MFTWPRKRQSVGEQNRHVIRVLAERSAAELLNECHTWPQMDVAELRGYARARAAGTVRQQARLAIVDLNPHVALPADLVAAAVERTVHLVVRDRLLQSQLPVVRRAAA
jgi:hypothetical protein